MSYLYLIASFCIGFGTCLILLFIVALFKCIDKKEEDIKDCNWNEVKKGKMNGFELDQLSRNNIKKPI